MSAIAVFSRVLRWFGRGHPIAERKRASRVDPVDDHPFDRRYRVDTAGLFYADQLVTGHERDAESAGYYATAPSLFCGALAEWMATLPEIGLTLSDYAFLDLGCGKGRIVLLASEYPFRQVTGVELHPGLAAIARRNLRLWTARRSAPQGWFRRLLRPAGSDQENKAGWEDRGPCGKSLLCPKGSEPPVEVLQGDAFSLPFPSGPLLIFFFNSFERTLIEPLLDRLSREAEGCQQPIDLIYIHPEFGSLFRRRAGVRVLAELDVPLSEEDSVADIFGVATDRVAIYRFEAEPLSPRAA